MHYFLLKPDAFTDFDCGLAYLNVVHGVHFTDYGKIEAVDFDIGGQIIKFCLVTSKLFLKEDQMFSPFS